MDFATELRYTTNLDSGVQMTSLKNAFLSGDQDAHRFIVSCFRSTSRRPVDLTGAGVTGYFIRADQSTVVIDGKVEDNCAVLTLPAACYAKQGRFSLVIKASMSGVIHTILWAEGAISQSHTGAIIDPGEVVPTLDELLAQIAAMEQATAAATTATETANAAAAQAVEIATAKGNEALQNVADAVTAQNETIGQLTEDILTKAPAINCEASGSMVSITDAAAQPAVQLVTHIEPVQEGEGDPSPDNVRPISGWDKVTAQRAGKNLFDPLNVKERTVYSITASRNEDGSIHLSGSPERGLHFIKPDDNVFLCLPAGTYYLTPDNFELHSPGEKYKGVFTLTKETEFTNGAIYFSSTAGTLDINVYIQLECGSTATDYEPYTAQPLTADLPETVYGGTLDWGTGVLTVTHKQSIITGVYELYTSVSEGYIGGRSTYSSMAINSRNNGYCDKLLPVMSPTNAAFACITFGANNNSIYIVLPTEVAGTTLETLNAYLAENPLTVVYPLAEPYTIQLTPQQLSVLRGTNNLWSDTGDTDLVYVADTKLYIDQKLAAIAAATLNN